MATQPKKEERWSKSPLVLLGIDQRFNSAAEIGKNPFFDTVIKLAHEFGWELRSVDAMGKDLHVDRPIKGALVSTLPTDPLSLKLLEMHCPTVRIGNLPHFDDNVMPAVLPDIESYGRLAAEHFNSCGFKEAAFIGFYPENITSNRHAMFFAFRERIREFGMNFHLMSDGKNNEYGETRNEKMERVERELITWLGSIPKPVGVFCATDIKAGCLNIACSKIGLKIPEEVAILGCGNSYNCELNPVSLSSIYARRDEEAKAAMLLLKGLMNGAPPPKKPIMIPGGIIERQSTNVLAVSDPVVAKTLRFIWDHYGDQRLTIDEIATESGFSRRTLERKFRISLNRGINSMLQKKRLEECCKLLDTTSLTTEELSEKVGFSSGNYLHRAFAKAFDMTPREYRLKS
jgi:LacI family transcriptional regulator